MLLASCTTATRQSAQSLTIFAASSLTDAFLEIREGFIQSHPNVAITFNFAGSSTLAAQIIEGASANIFASANEQQIQSVVGQLLASQQPLVFAKNQLVIIMPQTNPANLQAFEDLNQQSYHLVLAMPGVPIREYADQMLANVSPEFADYVLAHVVSEEPNVRQVALKVQLGEADAGIVYQSDITPSLKDSITILSIPTEYNVIAQFFIAQIASENPAATLFIEYVLSSEGQAILSKWGFCPIATCTT